jgi:DNA-binding IclR family transcriptional regulator
MSESVRAVDRALDILLCFSQEQPTLSLTQLAEQIALSKSTVHRLLTTLETKRFVSRDKATGAYHLGYRLMEMAALVLQDADRQQWVSPYLQGLSDECGETVDLAVLDGPHVVYLQVVESLHRVKIAAAVGQRLPVHCTASGKAFMAFLPEEEVSQILATGLTPYTERTRVALPDLLEDLRLTRSRGFAVSTGEYEHDIHAIAAPILDAEGYPMAVIAIVGPSYRLPHERMLELGESARLTTDTIRREIGPATLSALLSRGTTS